MILPSIQTIAPEDIEALQQLAQRVNAEQVLPLLSPSGCAAMQDATATNVAGLGDCDRNLALKAIVGAQIAGYVAWREGCYVTQLYVDIPFQGAGIGTLLMNEVVKRATRFPLTLRASANAVGFYEKYGFAASGPEKSDKGILYIEMEYDHQCHQAAASGPKD